MARLAASALLACLALPSIVAAADSGAVKSGRWEYESSTQIPGMEGMAAPAMPALPPGVELPPGVKLPVLPSAGGMKTKTVTKCIDADDPVPVGEQSDDCTVTKLEIDGASVRWAATCKTPQGEGHAEGDALYSGDSMVGTTRIEMPGPDGKPMRMTQKTKGRYLGPCE